MEGKVDNLVDCLAFLEQANIEKEGWIDYFEGVIQSMSNKLCWCGDHKVSLVLVEAGTEELMVDTGGKNACIQGLHGDYIVIF